ncbi:MAG: sigma-54-dependent Fis family transcriptional regulator [Cytophagales bacterium]|jgi:DNA-binding NtrC family response regulator|nr:sigma-54-dependent Fis family transcriptional regulator [Cytophagales bacterium]MCA6367845.1 sigma-54-dependent Fis family transcriptional regulator [Cytophagales bacterium]MCA6371020.1 sigma-54-dependent Fis family transcriptional regulator [Cytophagales bacterium]MCA6377166.1 sigma-54-dependent Fis family transcriptional regulator [Cytophagales bacterium]MCA6384669.1 sigma-54-dependent Fis family transcriptional regulator [Cytophagales bacterium]
MPKILLIEDEASIRSVLKDILKDQKELGLIVDEAKDGAEGLLKLESENYDLTICDIKMPKMDGMEVLQKAKEKGINTTFVMISAHGSTELAVDATKMGAYDFLQKPPDLNRLLLTVRNALDKNTLVKEAKSLKRKVSHKYEMIGRSEALQEVMTMIEKVAPTEARVLITGPNGSGKELVARQIHEKSNRSNFEFVEVNCAAIPSELIESELFGHEKGSFTSAIKQRIGKFEQAESGTLFLDEIGDMTLSAQAKVLRALQENKITRVGGERDTVVNVRVLAATNKDLKKEIAEGRFREDLYHRLSVILIKVPSLAERKEDIPLLVEKFLGDIAAETGAKKKEIKADAINELEKHPWTGNIRELRNVTERLVIMGDPIISLKDAKKYL